MSAFGKSAETKGLKPNVAVMLFVNPISEVNQVGSTSLCESAGDAFSTFLRHMYKHPVDHGDEQDLSAIGIPGIVDKMKSQAFFYILSRHR